MIGRLKEKSRGGGQHYDIEVEADETGERAVAVHWCGKALLFRMALPCRLICNNWQQSIARDNLPTAVAGGLREVPVVALFGYLRNSFVPSDINTTE